MSWTLIWPTPQTKGDWVATGQLNRSQGGAPAVDASGLAVNQAASSRWINNPRPLTYPKGEQNLLGLVAVNAIAPPALVAAKGSQVPTPLSQQPLATPLAGWDIPTDEIPGGGYESGL
jgi:hypothetical protein